MMNDEKYIIDQIKNHRESVDMEELWAEIQSEIPRKKRKNRMPIWLFFGLLAAVVFFIGADYLIGLSSNQSEQSLKSTAFNASAINKDESKLNTIERISGIFSESDQSREKEDDAEIKQANINLDNYAMPSSTASFQSPVSPLTGLSSVNSEDKSQSTTAGSREFKNEKLEINLLNEENDLPPNIEKESIHATITEEGEVLEPVYLNSKANKTLLDAQHIRAIYPKAIAYSRQKIDHNLVLHAPDPVQHSSKNLINRWSIYLYGGASYSNRSLQARSEDLKLERDRREVVESTLGGWLIETGFGYRLSKKLTLKSGLNVARTYERIEYIADYQVNGELVNQSSTTTFQDGTLLVENTEIESRLNRHIEEKRYNALQHISIPLEISYQFWDHSKLKLYLAIRGAGIINQKYQGVTSLSSSTPSYDLSLDLGDKFNPSIGLSYGIALNGSRHLSDKIDLVFGLSYTRSPKINSKNYLIDQQYNSITFTSGISRRF